MISHERGKHKVKIFEKNKVVKKILIIFIAITMTTNFVMPNYVQAKSPGEKLVSGLFYLIAKLGDVGISIMQKYMTGEDEPINGKNMNIKYSPGMIFANKVPMLDINFINPRKESITIDDEEVMEAIELRRIPFSAGQSGANIPAENILYTKKFDIGTTTAMEEYQKALSDLLEQYGYNDATDRSNSGNIYNWTAEGQEYELKDITTPASRSVIHTITLRIISEEETSSGTIETQLEAIEKTKENWLTEYGYYESDTTKLKDGTPSSTGATSAETVYEWKISSGRTYSLKIVMSLADAR